MVWYGMVEVCEGAPVAVSGWVLTDRHDVRPCAASSLLRVTISVSNIIGGTGTLGPKPSVRVDVCASSLLKQILFVI